MSRRLVQALERALADTVQNFPRDASVLVQFKAGDLAEVREALTEARAKLGADKPAIVLEPEPMPETVTTIEGEQPPAN